MKTTIITICLILASTVWGAAPADSEMDKEVLLEISNQLLAMGQEEYKKGEFEVANSLWDRALEIRKSLGLNDTKETGNIYFLVSLSVSAQGNNCGALETLDEAIRIFESSDSSKNLKLAKLQKEKFNNSCAVSMK
jgi:tetratricopeptide (TPR) repeat protein